MESPIYTPSPIREQTQFLDELTALRVEYEKNMKRLYEQQADFKAAWRIVRQLIEFGAPDDLHIVVSYDRNDDDLCFYCFGENTLRPGNILEALDRSGLIDECTVSSNSELKNMLLIKFKNQPLLRFFCPKPAVARLQEAA